VRRHLVPNLGKHRLDRLRPEHLERLYRHMIDGGASPATAHQVHRTARTALGEAARRGYVGQNVAAVAKAPRIEMDEVEPYSLEEVRRILDAADGLRNGARWAIALALGLRQGEVLGLRWTDVDLDAGMLTIRKNRLRPRDDHGCGVPCGRTAGRCRDRVMVNDETGPTKSTAGRRMVGLPDSLVELLRRHGAEQDCDREAARQLWNEGGFVFTSRTGEPINPNTDYRRTRRQAPRRPAHCGHGAARLGCAGADGDADNGLVNNRDGGSLSARHRPDSARGCSSCRGLAVALRAGQMRPKLRPRALVPPDFRLLGRRLPWWERRRRDLNPREG
jgi:integrase